MSASRRATFTEADRRRRLATRHGLARPFADVVEAAGALVGLHASDVGAAYLTARARVADFSRQQLERALYDDVTLIKHLAMRRTLFVVPTELLAVIQPAVSDDLLAAQRRALAKDVVAHGLHHDGMAWLAATEAAALSGLERLGGATGAAWSRAVPELQAKLSYAPGKPYGGDVGVAGRVFTILALTGAVRRGRPTTWTSSQHRWEPQAIPSGMATVEVARAELVRRWLACFGPATVADLVWWSGLGITKIRPALAAVGAVEVDLHGEVGVALPDDLDPVAATEDAPEAAPEEVAPWVAALPALDPTAMGWKRRQWFLDERDVPLLFDRNGNVGATLWADGRIVGGWSQRKSGEVVWRVLRDVGRERTAALEAEVASLQGWLGSTVAPRRFPVPLDKELQR